MIQGIGDYIANGFRALIFIAILGGALFIGIIWGLFSIFSSDDDETITDEKLQPKEIVITVNPETGASDTTYVYQNE